MTFCFYNLHALTNMCFYSKTGLLLLSFNVLKRHEAIHFVVVAEVDLFQQSHSLIEFKSIVLFYLAFGLFLVLSTEKQIKMQKTLLAVVIENVSKCIVH